MTAIFTQGGHIEHDIGSLVSGGSFSITSSPSSKVKVVSNFIFTSPLSVSFSGGNMSGMVPGSVNGVGTISATASKTKQGTFVMRNNDTGTLVGTAQPSGGGSPVPVSFSVKLVDSQSKVVCN